MSGLKIHLSRSKHAFSSTRNVALHWTPIRCIHRPRTLLYPVEEGLGEFLPPAALRTVGVEYQQGLLDRLNEEVRGTPQENSTVVQTVIDTAPLKERTLAFNYSSLALNNSFFLDQLKPPPAPPATTHQSEISFALGEALRMQHGSIAQFKSSFSSAALGMFTSGWIWFVSDKNGNTGIIPTFGPGTLLIRSRSYMANVKGMILGEEMGQLERGAPVLEGYEFPPEELDGRVTTGTSPFSPASPSRVNPTSSSSSSQPPPGVSPTSPSSGLSSSPSGPSQTPGQPPHPRFIHTSQRSLSNEFTRMPTSLYDDDTTAANKGFLPKNKVDLLNIGEVLHPLFCLPVYEHAWMAAGYGIWGKEEWLKKFWTVVDWKKVSDAYDATYMRRI